MKDLTPRQIVAELDRHIIGQDAAKRAVAVAVRNRWRQQQLDDAVGREITPKNIIMIGPTGVGKTEIARRLAKLVSAPFIKVEASKYTEVGYHGRDVESMIRDLLEQGVNMVRAEHSIQVKERAEAAVEKKLVGLLLGDSRDDDHASEIEFETKNNMASGEGERSKLESEISIAADSRTAAFGTSHQHTNASRDDSATGSVAAVDAIPSAASAADPVHDAHRRVRERMTKKLRDGLFEDREIEITITEKQSVPVISMMAPEQMDPAVSSMLESLIPDKTRRRRVTVARARTILLEEETNKLIDREKIVEQAIERTEQTGMIFLDEIDKIATSSDSGKGGGGADVSRQGVQRDLLPIVEGSAVNSRHGIINTDQILFIAAGAFHSAKVSDLMPELQGRFPIRVELEALTAKDFKRILTEPDGALTRQMTHLLGTEGLTITFEPAAIDAMAELAAEANASMENIGARRLMTVIECVFEQISFDAPDLKEKRITITAPFVQERIRAIMKDEDLRRFVL